MPTNLEVLETARKVIDELMPAISKISCDVGLINDGCVVLNKAIQEEKEKQ